MVQDLDHPRRGNSARYLGAASIAAIALCAAAPAAAQSSGSPVVTAATQPQTDGGTASPPAPAAGQPTPNEAEAPNQEIVVTGFRGSLARALNMKQRENASTDSILAEDI